jgi:hypothetical protein
MPIQPVNRMDPLPVERPEDVAALVELLPRARDDSRLRFGLSDHFSYLAAVHPEWFAPYREVVLTDLLDGFSANFGDYCVLLHGAPDPCVEHLTRRLRGGWDTTAGWALAAIGTEAGLAAVAAHVRADGDVRGHYEELGVWVPPDGPAQYRFSPHRRAVFRRQVDDPAALDSQAHPVGLPLDSVVADPDATPVTWHYVSLRLSDVPGLPDWPAERVHLVGPRANCGWTLSAGIDGQGRYRDVTAEFEDPFDEEDAWYLRRVEERGGGYGAVDLRPYDADLVYCNGHIQLTPDVVGTAGGPPIGIYANPHCRSCGRLQFHVVSVEHHVREYGDGWRSLFLCADCGLVTCNATGWN